MSDIEIEGKTYTTADGGIPGRCTGCVALEGEETSELCRKITKQSKLCIIFNCVWKEK